jgi:parallel beta-helix repeat protein
MKRTSKIYFILWILFFVAAIPVTAYAVDGQIKIAQGPSTTFPIVIDQPGSYVLTSNIIVSSTSANGIEIATDDVTLDLNGHVLTGPKSGTGNGINTVDSNNITVINGIVRDFGAFGVNLMGLASNRQVKDIKAFENGITGILVQHGVVTDCIANYNGGDGITITYSSIINSVANYNDMRGIHASEHCSVINCTTLGNASHGVYTPIAPATITNCTSTDNTGSGFYVIFSTVTNCTAFRNNQNGISANGSCRIEGNNLRNNTQYGLYLQSDYNYAIKNSASNNGTGNFYAVYPANNYMPTSLTAPDAASANIGW